MKAKKLVKEFLTYTEENRKPSTLRHYRGRLALFRKRYGHRKLESLKQKDIDDYVCEANHWPDGKLKAQDTRRANVVVLDQMFRFAVRRGRLRKMPYEAIERPQSRKRDRIPTAAEDEAVERIAPHDFLQIFTALRRTGARPGELAGARIEQYDREKRLIVLDQHKTDLKTGAKRKIGIPRALQPVIDAAIGGRTEGHIFLKANGDPWDSQQLSRAYRTLRDRLGFSRDLVLYCQRHSVGTKVTRTRGIAQAAQVLGHISTATTQRYNHPDDCEIAQNLDLID